MLWIKKQRKRTVVQTGRKLLGIIFSKSTVSPCFYRTIHVQVSAVQQAIATIHNQST
jgi:hypothetical protein